jgi:N-acetyl sugar amidotransferase
MNMQYCKKCLYPAIGVNLILDDEGVCSACRVAEEFDKMTPEFWAHREKLFQSIIEKYRLKDGSNYDCIVAVSGGKDSYWQTYLVKKICGLNPLLVTYHGNNYLPEGQGNLDRMRDVFGVDQLILGPSLDTLRKLNRVCFKKMGDMNWHAHAGIKTVPISIAVKFKIPLVIWGEITWLITGMFSPDDYVEYNKRTVFEHDMRGFSWKDMVGEEGLTPQDLVWLHFPSDEEISRIGVRGIFIGNFFKWDPNQHAKQMQDGFGFEFARQPFERTYRRMSNLDDMHENGIHDYMKFIKFGYGRATDHASKDIRTGYMTRDEGLEMVRKYDHVKPLRDLKRWLTYVGMTEQEFDAIADGFRDPRVWWIRKGEWWKHNIWGGSSSYGPVNLTDPKKIQTFEDNEKRLNLK